MNMRSFGDSPVKVSAIALGCWIFGVDWWGHYSDSDALRLMQHALDSGITFFDTGDAYGNGRSETLVGQFLKTLPRSSVQVGSKFGYDFYTDPGTPGSHRERKQDFSPAFLRRALEASLQRLDVPSSSTRAGHRSSVPNTLRASSCSGSDR